MRRTAVFCTGRDGALVDRIQRFRKTIFVDHCGWDLAVVDDRETDQFDTPDAVHSALFSGDEIQATFRATRTDRPYLAAAVFPQLAVVSPYPRRADVWEISRFGALADQAAARINYALMFAFAQRIGASSLVAIADLPYERFLRTIGIRTRRYGPPQIIGTNALGRELRAVAGEIPTLAQDPRCLGSLLALLDNVEITDVAQIFGPARVSA